MTSILTEGLLSLLITGVAALVGVLWIVMPFAIFGTKRLLREQGELLRRIHTAQLETNELLRSQRDSHYGTAPAPSQWPSAVGEPVRKSAGAGPGIALIASKDDRVL